MKRLFLCMSVLAAGTNAIAQSDIDALRYSQQMPSGSARFTGMAGSFGALGGDISSLSQNPAGVAVYRKNEFSFTPAFYRMNTSSTYNGLNSTDTKNNFNFSEVGLAAAFVNQRNDSMNSGWVSTNLALGYNRLNSFHSRTDIFGYSNGSLFTDAVAASVNGTSPENLDQFGSRMFFDFYLIDTVPGQQSQYRGGLPAGYSYMQHRNSETAGALAETVISFGGNYANKLYIGATVGLPKIRYTEDAYYEEIDHTDSITPFANYRYYSYLKTNGNGFNFKIGAIYRITDWLRLGGAVHTPSFFRMTDTYDNRLVMNYDNGETFEEESPAGSFKYKLTTPMRAIGSIGVVIKKRALVNFDYEFVDYPSAVLRSSPNAFHEINPAIKEKYQSAGNLRAGTEIRFDPVLFRLGYALYGSPYKPGVNDAHTGISSYSGGIGFRESNYFIDLAYVLTRYSENYYLYDPSTTSPARNDYNSSNFVITLGWKY